MEEISPIPAKTSEVITPADFKNPASKISHKSNYYIVALNFLTPQNTFDLKVVGVRANTEEEALGIAIVKQFTGNPISHFVVKNINELK